MSFSAFNVGRQMMTLTSNKLPQLRLGSKPVAGGSFTPTTLEAAFVMRSSLDYSWEKAFNDKYRAMMQNRLNDLQKKLQEAYTDILNLSMSQQVGQEASKNLRADVRLDGLDGTGNASTLEGVAGENGFEDIGIVPKTNSRSDNQNERSIDYTAASLNTANRGTDLWRAPGIIDDRLDPNYPNPGKYADDGLSGYGRRLGNDEVQFRTLLDQTTAAGNVSNDVHITMRIEDDPPPPTEVDGSLDMLNSVTSAILGGPADPTYYNQKIDQHSTQYKTGGFWSTVNYLYNFAPREMKYTYAVGYTVNTDEAGDDEYLLNGELVDDRDIPGAGQAYLQSGSRVKWSSFDPLEGYQAERSGTSAFYGTVNNRAKAWLEGSETSGGIEKALWDTDFTDAEGQVKIVENLIFQSGTYTYNGAFINEDTGASDPNGMGLGVAGTTLLANGTVIQTQANSASGLVSLLDSNIEIGSIFKHKVDLTEDGNNDDVTMPGSGQDFKVNDRAAIRSSLFFNHYEVETRTVEFNNSQRKDIRELTTGITPNDITDDGIGKIYAYGDVVRSKSVDTSKNYDLVDPDPGDSDTTTREITRSSGNVNNSFNGEFIQGQHKILSVNGQDIVGNELKQASPIIGNFEIGRYEGVMRSDAMTRNLVEYTAPSQMEIDASNAVPTDWYQGELLVKGPIPPATPADNPADPNDGFVWFPFVEDTLYTGIPNGGADPQSGFTRAGAPKALVQTRNTFNLSSEEFMQLEPAANWVTDASGVRRPTYQKRDYWIDLDLRGIAYDPAAVPFPIIPKLFVNGRQILLGDTAATASTVDPVNGPLAALPTITEQLVPVINTPSGNKSLSVRINLKDYLQEGTNTIALEASDAPYNAGLFPGDTNYNEGIRITAAPIAANTALVSGVLNSKVITGYDNIKAVKYNPEFTRDNTLKVQSRWQTRLVPPSSSNDVTGKLVKMASDPATTGTSYKVSNSFIEMVINMLNQQKYRDIFRLGMLSNLNKLAIQGQANLPNGASMQGAITMYYDQNLQSVVLVQDRLTANS